MQGCVCVVKLGCVVRNRNTVNRTKMRNKSDDDDDNYDDDDDDDDDADDDCDID